jgi:hypothetical protein
MRRMPTPKSGESPRPGSSAGGTGQTWPVWAQVVMSGALVYHLAAILAGALAAHPSSGIEKRAAGVFRSYFEIINQGYGYRYYARLNRTVDPRQPRPWGTPVVIAELEFERAGEGTTRDVIRLPDRRRPWPRLRYQRQLDLAYHLSVDPRWAASYARHLCKTRGCSRVAISTRDHYIPDLDRVRAASIARGASPVDLEAESTYGPRVKLGDFRCTDF